MLHDILQLLSDGSFHSGVELAHLLGVSKTTIHNKIQEMLALGIEVSAVRGKGYRIFEGLDLLDVPALAQRLPGINLDIRLKTASTNDDCRQRLSTSGDRLVLCSAELQSAGRGRRGKAWVSPFAKHLYVSLGFTLSLPLSHVSGITLAAGVVVAKLLDDLGVKGVAVKWPNDIWIGGEKVAGILTEVVGDAQGPCSVVIGLGLNVHPVAMKLDKQQGVAFIREHGVHMSRTEILVKLTHALIAMRNTYEREGLAAYLPLWQRYDFLRTKRIMIALHDRVIEATCLGITQEGLLRIDEPPFDLSSGEVSISRPLS